MAALERGTRVTVALVALTVTTGVIDAVSYLALGHVFTAAMTGNVLLLGFAVGGGEGLSAAASSVSLAGFVAGALVGSRLEQHMLGRQRRWFVRGLLVESVLLGVAGLVAWRIGGVLGPLSVRHYVVIALVAFAMGMRSVTTLRAGIPDLTTTLATHPLTALMDSLGAPHARVPLPVNAQLRRVEAVLALFAGGLLGALMLHAEWRPAVPLLIVAGAVLIIAGVYSRGPRYADDRDGGGPAADQDGGDDGDRGRQP